MSIVKMESIKCRLKSLQSKIGGISLDLSKYKEFVEYNVGDAMYKDTPCVLEFTSGNMYARDKSGNIMIDIKTGRKKYIGSLKGIS